MKLISKVGVAFKVEQERRDVLKKVNDGRRLSTDYAD